MTRIGGRMLARGWGLLAAGGLAAVAAVAITTGAAHAQIDIGEYALYQPHQGIPVGRAWCNANHTAEYWAYFDGEFHFAGSGNGPDSRWRLEAQYLGSMNYQSFAAFKAAVLALPMAQGKTVVFQNHSVAEEAIEN